MGDLNSWRPWQGMWRPQHQLEDHAGEDTRVAARGLERGRSESPEFLETTQPDERSRGQYVEMMERAAALADDLVDNVAG